MLSHLAPPVSQDLSVAGKRAGLKHTDNGDEETTRSGLFMEAVRIIKEMREATHGKYPSFALWENVPGAFSSNKGEDFRVVLEELIKIVEPSCTVPAPDKNGWPYADCYVGTGWSLAYRVFDAQYWGKSIRDRDSGIVRHLGTPQRRRRIHLILDLRGERAGEVLFEREGLRGYFATGRTPWQGIAGDAENCIGAADRAGEEWLHDGGSDDSSEHCSRTGADGDGRNDPGPDLGVDLDGMRNCLFQPVAYSFDSLASNSMKSSNPHSGCRQVEVAKTLDTTDPNPSKNQGGIAVVEILPFDTTQITSPMNYSHPKYGDPCHPLAAGAHPPAIVCCIDGDKIGKAERSGGSGLGIRPGDKMYTLTAKDAGQHAVCIPINDKATRYKGGGASRNHDGSGNGLGIGADGDPSPTLTAGDRHAVVYSIGNGQLNQISMSEVCNTLDCMHDKQAILEVQGMDCRNGELNGDLCGTLQAKPNGVFSYNCIHPVILKTQYRYIVRRLTPTECARLQGFADRWGDIDPKSDFSDEEYSFWLEVRNTHARINGKAEKDYTKDQMLTWYNKLLTDSAEYKCGVTA